MAHGVEGVRLVPSTVREAASDCVVSYFYEGDLKNIVAAEVQAGAVLAEPSPPDWPAKKKTPLLKTPTEPDETPVLNVVEVKEPDITDDEPQEETVEEGADQQVDPQTSKVSGYLHKKGKLRLVSSWKRYWFVLEGRLLLYYRSKAEYDTISPCKGSITLGSPCNIKPGSASNCVFQIETRNHTITLRADTRAEQDKWMLAILGALKQTSQTTRMSHFRYSADDLAVRALADKPPVPALIRQNTLPDRMGNNFNKQMRSKEKNVKTMVERIESIGGQSYIPVEGLTAEHLKASKASPKLPKNNNLKKLLDKQLSDISANSDQGDWIKEDDLNIETIENDLYATFDPPLNAPKDPHIYQEIPNQEHVEPEVIIENPTYVELNQKKNNVEYWEPIYDSTTPEYEGETVEAVETVEPVLPPRPIPQESAEEEEKNEKKVRKQSKMTKRRSFVIRMFNRIKRNENSNKNEAKEKNIEKLSTTGESSEKEVTENSLEEEPASEKTTEINEHDQGVCILPDVIEELNGLLHTKEEQEKEDKTDEVKESVTSEPENVNNNSEPVPPQLEQLSALPQPQLSLKQDENDQIEDEEPNDNNNAHEGDKEDINHSDFDYDLYDPSQRLNIPRPKLICKPKRQKRLKVASEVTLPIVRFYEQQNESDEFRLKDDNKLMTIDEILDDLENHNYEPFSRQKVKELIEKFNDTEHETDEDGKEEEQIHVQLRRKRVEQTEELNSLLDELSKVANAPVSSPDMTNLEDNGPYTEEEWKNIVPIRKRRLSDPDYDIPRPHSALQIMPNSEKEETRMQPTRFFGPVIIEQINGDTTSCGTSITPDSLEVDVLSYQAKHYTPSIEEDRSMRSYTSHIYASNDSHLNNNFTHNSHINQNLKANTGGEYGTDLDQNKDDTVMKPKSLSALIVSKVESDQSFYLNEENDNNNNQKQLATAQIEKDQKLVALAGPVGEVMSTSVCYDSLEPSAGEAIQ
ncbi:uncharacterized protein [Atheta coriaria]